MWRRGRYRETIKHLFLPAANPNWIWNQTAQFYARYKSTGGTEDILPTFFVPFVIDWEVGSLSYLICWLFLVVRGVAVGGRRSGGSLRRWQVYRTVSVCVMIHHAIVLKSQHNHISTNSPDDLPIRGQGSETSHEQTVTGNSYTKSLLNSKQQKLSNLFELVCDNSGATRTELAGYF